MLTKIRVTMELNLGKTLLKARLINRRNLPVGTREQMDFTIQ